jgi:hypothetical protein
MTGVAKTRWTVVRSPAPTVDNQPAW